MGQPELTKQIISVMSKLWERALIQRFYGKYEHLANFVTDNLWRCGDCTPESLEYAYQAIARDMDSGKRGLEEPRLSIIIQYCKAAPNHTVQSEKPFSPTPEERENQKKIVETIKREFTGC